MYSYCHIVPLCASLFLLTLLPFWGAVFLGLPLCAQRLCNVLLTLWYPRTLYIHRIHLIYLGLPCLGLYKYDNIFRICSSILLSPQIYQLILFYDRSMHLLVLHRPCSMLPFCSMYGYENIICIILPYMISIHHHIHNFGIMDSIYIPRRIYFPCPHRLSSFCICHIFQPLHIVVQFH